MSWGAVVGQPLATRLLKRVVLAGKAAHAYLFVGPDGVGKRTTALTLAGALQCTALTAAGEPCGCCHSCERLRVNPPVHPDLHLIQPEGRYIRTQQIKELQAEMYARPTMGRYRIALIDGADRMNPESGNRLLKLLEEPPGHAVFVLLTANLSGVLSTLVSRCQSINFPPLSPDDVAAILASRQSASPEQIRLFAALSGGSAGRAVAMLETPEVLQRRDQAAQLLREIPTMDDHALLATAEALEKQRDTVEEWLELSLMWVRDAIVLKQGTGSSLLLNADQIAGLRSLAQTTDRDVLLQVLQHLVEARQHIQRSANLRLVLDVLFLRLQHVLTAPGNSKEMIHSFGG